jgi:hypothetical protein
VLLEEAVGFGTPPKKDVVVVGMVFVIEVAFA